MKRLVLAAAAAGGAAFGLRRLARKGPSSRDHCCEAMRARCGQASGDCEPS